MFSSVSDACRPSPWSDAHLTWRAVFECNELARSPSFAVVQSNETGRGVTGFGYFCRNKSGSAAVTNPGQLS